MLLRVICRCLAGYRLVVSQWDSLTASFCSNCMSCDSPPSCMQARANHEQALAEARAAAQEADAALQRQLRKEAEGELAKARAGRGLLGREEEGRLLGREGKVSVGQSVLNLKNCSVQGRHLGIITQAASRVQS